MPDIGVANRGAAGPIAAAMSGERGGLVADGNIGHNLAFVR